MHLAFYQGLIAALAPVVKSFQSLSNEFIGNDEFYRVTQHVLPSIRTPVAMTTSFVAIMKEGTPKEQEQFAQRTWTSISSKRIALPFQLRDKLLKLAKIENKDAKAETQAENAKPEAQAEAMQVG